MLPDIRSVLIAVIATLGLLIGAFGLVAAFRVAQESRSGSFQAEFAQRSRVLVAANGAPRTIAPIENPAPLEANPVRPVVIENAPDIAPPIAVASSQPEPPAIEPPVEPPPFVAAAAESVSAAVDPPSAPPVGGPLVEPADATHTAQPPHRGVTRAAAVGKVQQEALAKARAARVARIARATAARRARAVQARAKQAATPASNVSFGSFGNSASTAWGSNASGNHTFGTGTFGR